jgi:hypothetical protein
MRLRLPFIGVPAQLMLHVWRQVAEQPVPRTLDKHIAAEPSLLAHWESVLSQSDQEDAQHFSQLLEHQVASEEDWVMSEDHVDSALRSCARCRLYLQSPWLDLQLPALWKEDQPMPENAIIDALYDWFAILECELLQALHPDWSE